MAVPSLQFLSISATLHQEVTFTICVLFAQQMTADIISIRLQCIALGRDYWLPVYSVEGFCYVEHWDDYKAYMMFPLDILHGDTETVIRTACEGSDAVEDWKSRFIGKPFDGDRFVDAIEERL